STPTLAFTGVVRDNRHELDCRYEMVCSDADYGSSRTLNLVPIDHVTVGAGRGSRTPKIRRSADFESAASASSAIPAWFRSYYATTFCYGRIANSLVGCQFTRPAWLIREAA